MSQTAISTVISPIMKLKMRIDRIMSLTLKKEMNMSAAQFRMLFALTSHPAITQKEIAAFWDVTEASVSRQIKLLETKGFISRTPKLTITASGQKTLTEGKAVLDGVFEEIFKSVSDADRIKIASLAETLLKDIIHY